MTETTYSLFQKGRAHLKRGMAAQATVALEKAKARDPEKGFDIAYYGDPRFVGWGGGLPVWRDGEVVGAVAVSGLSSADDIDLATLGVKLVSGE